MDRRSLLRAIALGSLSTVTGCGVASRSGVVVDGPGPSAGQGGAAPGGSQPPPFTSGLTPEGLIQNFLRQGAGDPGDLAGSIKAYLTYLGGEFMSTTASQLANPAQTKLNVVWYDTDVLTGSITPLGGTGYSVSLPVVVLGTLNAKCVLEPPPSGQQRLRVDFTLTKDDDKSPGETLRISNIKGAPPGMMISSDALAGYYEYRSVYFWDSAGECLVPDPRHVPAAWDEGVRMKRMVDWLLADPVSWLSSQVTPVDATLFDAPIRAGKNIVVNLSHQALQNGQSPVDASRVISQLTWTLYTEAKAITTIARDAESPIKLKIDNTDSRAGGRFYTDNFTAARAAGMPVAFAILDKEHKVRRLPSGSADDRSPVPLLESADPAKNQNKDIEWAAMIRDRGRPDEGPVSVAIVHRDKNAFSLRVGAARRDGTRVSEDLATLRDVKLSGHSFLRPGFFDERMIVAVCDGALHYVPRDGKAPASPLTVPNVDGQITAFAMAPDGRRIAIVTARGLYVAALARSGPASLVAGPAQHIATILDQLTGVAFTEENWLAVSGRYSYNDSLRIVEISLDGGLVGRPSNSSTWHTKIQGTPTITSLTAHADAPHTAGRSRVFYTANAAAYEAGGTATELTPEMETLAAVPAHDTAVNAFFLE